jgi:microcystin-dependent protein
MEGVIGYTTLFAGNFAPKNWAFCNGQIVSISSNTALFSILGTTYGGNGTTTFALPNLQGLAVVSAGQGPGLSLYSLGETAGYEQTTITMENMPSHSHPLSTTITPSAATTVNSPAPSNAVYGQGSENMFNPTGDSTFQHTQGSITTGTNNNGQTPFSTLQPIMGLNYVICMFGVYPARQ